MEPDTLYSSVYGASYEWRLNNALLPLTTRLIRITHGGSYLVQVRSAASCLSAPSTTAIVLSTARARQQQAVRIYPNPTSQRFTIAGELLDGVQVKILSVQILDELGRLVSEQATTQAVRLSRQDGQKQEVYFLWYGSKNQRVVARQTTQIRRGI